MASGATDQAAFRKFVENRLQGSVTSEETGIARLSAEEERLRRETRLAIQGDIFFVEKNRDELLRPESDGLIKVVNRAASRDLKHARSQEAYLDSKLLAMTADMGSQQMQRLNTGQGTFDVAALMIRLRQASNAREDVCDFAAVAKLGAFISRRAPAVNFLLGPIQIQRRVVKRGPIQRIVRNAADLQRPSKLTETEAKLYENQTTGYVHTVYQRLAEAGGPINVFEFVINPTSFSQTVENIFFLSFLVQQKRARIFVDEEDNLPYAQTMAIPQQEHEDDEAAGAAQQETGTHCHFIFDITEDEWRALAREFNITTSYIPTRPARHN